MTLYGLVELWGLLAAGDRGALDDWAVVGYALDRMRPLLVFVAALALLGCKREAPAYRYQLVFGKGSAIRGGGRLFLGDTELGTIERPRERASTGARMAVVSFVLGEDTVVTKRKDELALRYPTPCGLGAPVRVRVADLAEREAKLRAGTHPNIKFRAAVIGDVPDGVEIWVDRSEGTPDVTVGEASIAEDAQPARLFDLGCADGHEVKVDGTVVGTVSREGIRSAVGADDEAIERERTIASGVFTSLARRSKGPVARARFFVGRGDRCYRSRLVVYVRSDEETDLGGAERRLSGRRLYQLPRRPDFFLRGAPRTTEADGGSVVELVAVDCAATD